MSRRTPLVRFQVVAENFYQKIEIASKLAGKSMVQGFRWQGQLLAAELIKNTPPYSGKSLERMLDKRAPDAFGAKPSLNDPEVESLSARKVGERRVERDIKRIIYGVKGADPRGRDSANAQDWGVLQKCEGKPAVRIMARPQGQVYGVEMSQFLASPTAATLEGVHKEHRGSSGRVTNAGRRDKAFGRWNWMNVIVAPEETLDKFIEKEKRNVGEAKGGWGASLIALGGRLSRGGWVGRHAKMPAGQCINNLDQMDNNWKTIHKVKVILRNSSMWAKGGDPDRIRERSLRGRGRAIAGYIGREMNRINQMSGAVGSMI